MAMYLWTEQLVERRLTDDENIVRQAMQAFSRPVQIPYLFNLVRDNMCSKRFAEATLRLVADNMIVEAQT